MHYRLIACLPVLLLAGCYVAPPPHPPVPVAQVEVVPVPPPGAYVWQPGGWRWDGFRYAWVPGRYVVRRAAYHRWIGPHWNGRGVWIPGHWV